jgi:FkbM family methyltransferase
MSEVPEQPVPVATVRMDAPARAEIGPVIVLPEGRAGHELLRKVFFELAAAAEPAIACDVGANEGEVARELRALLPNSEVHGFEANPHIHAAGAADAEASGVKWHNLAVADVSGSVDLHIPRRLSRGYWEGQIYAADIPQGPLTGKSSLLQRAEEGDYETVTVPSVTLDDILRDAIAPDGANVMLWIDVEGAALSVLRGARNVLGRTLALVVEVEAHAFWEGEPSLVPVLDELRDAGFVALIRDREFGEAQFNILFVRKNKVRFVNGTALSDLAETGEWPKQGIFVAPAPAPAVHRGPRVPVVIPAFENPSDIRAMVSELDRIDGVVPWIVDNGSESAEMRACLDQVSDRAHIFRLGRNLGPHYGVFDGRVWEALPDIFCVTDADLAFHPAMPRDAVAQLRDAMNRFEVAKAGLALDISYRAGLRNETFLIAGEERTVRDWELRFWANPIGETRGGDPIFRANLDTTFAVYDKRKFDREEEFFKAIRIAGRFTARHLPWHEGEGRMGPDELARYKAAQRFSYYLPQR